MIDLFERKELEDFSKKVRDVFNLLTISSKYRVAGSASLKNNRFIADYDLNELYQKKLDTDEALDLIYKMFKNKFEECEKSTTCFITDLKCGLNSDGEPLRWNKEDIKKGFKILEDGRKVAFQDCILSKTTFKLDVVKIIDGKFTEFSNNYYIKLGNSANFNPHDLTSGHLKSELKKSYDEYFYSYQNLFKGLKRAFSYYLMEDDKHQAILEKLLKYFNSPVGKLYHIKGQLGTLGLVIENKSGFRNPEINDVKNNIQIILKELADFDVPKIKEELGKAMKATTLSAIEKSVVKVETALFDIINRFTLAFVLKNPDVAIY
jgi:hypothetical protein